MSSSPEYWPPPWRRPRFWRRIPLQNLLKNELHVDRSANAAFFFWAGLAWYFKPFAGIFTDAFPDLRKPPQELHSGQHHPGGASVVRPDRHAPPVSGKLLLVSIVINAFMVIASTVVGGYMVEIAQATSGSGRLTAIREFVQQGTFIIVRPHRRIPGQHRLRMDGRGLRRHHVPAGAGHHLLPA